MKLLIDGDIFVYRACAALEQETYWDYQDLWTISSDPTECVGSVVRTIEGLMKDFKTTDILVAFTGSENFRKDVYPTYKGNRAMNTYTGPWSKKSRKPLGLKDVAARVQQSLPSILEEPLEADDILGLLADEDSVIVSRDKDFRSVPCNLHNPDQHNKGEFETITLETADHNFRMQALMGDAVDGYPGLPGIGPKKAEKLLEKNTDILDIYEKMGYTRELGSQMARCARILRKGEYDWNTKEIKLWNN